jgi:hypothetical protein
MTIDAFEMSLQEGAPPEGISAPLEALWWDAHGDWSRAHALVDELETQDGMAVHAYLHRKGEELSNAEYWYRLAGRACYRSELADEWKALVEMLLGEDAAQSSR